MFADTIDEDGGGPGICNEEDRPERKVQRFLSIRASSLFKRLTKKKGAKNLFAPFSPTILFSRAQLRTR